MSRATKIMVGLVCAALWLPAAASAATLSDSFAGRETVQGLPQEILGSNVGAGREAGEPVPQILSPAGHSVWVEWQATSSGYVTVSACGSAIPTVIGVYGGTELANLDEYGSATSTTAPECSGVLSGFTFLAFTGFKYEILVDGNGFYVPPALPPGTEGSLSLRIEATPPPPNDAFKDATPLGGRPSEEPGGARFQILSGSGYNWAATQENGEPNHAGDPGGASVWYSWTAPESGEAGISLCCGSAPNLLGVYVGDAVDALTEVEAGTGSVDIPVTRGTTYRIAVDGKLNLFLGAVESGRFTLMIRMILARGPGLPDNSSVGDSRPLDLTKPNTTIFKRKVRSKARSATFSFRSNEPGSTFRCQLDRRKATTCVSPKSFKGLAQGRHVLKVYATDAAGNDDQTPAKAQFSIGEPRRGRG